MDYDTYEDLQGLWADLEAALALVLTHPAQVGNFEAKVLQLDAWLQELLAHDRDAGLYLMYQLVSSSHTGYSAAHALVCAALSHILAGTYHLPPQERDALVRAALTMNIGMTQLQDQLALQRERPSAAQQEAIRMHPVEGRRLLERMQITNGLWLDVVTLHHINTPPQLPLLQQQAAERLARLLATVDRYAAMISPRRSRAGRSVAESVHVITGPSSQLYQKAGDALLHSVGMYPPGCLLRSTMKPPPWCCAEPRSRTSRKLPNYWMRANCRLPSRKFCCSPKSRSCALRTACPPQKCAPFWTPKACCTWGP